MRTLRSGFFSLLRLPPILILLAASLCLSGPTFAGYTLNILDVPAIYNNSAAYKINNAGQIIGETNNWASDSKSVAVLWDNGQYINMTAQAGLDGQLQTLRLSALNNHRTVLGFVSQATCDTGCPGTTHAVKWENGAFANAPAGAAINDSGQIAGSANGTARLWENGGTSIALATPGNYQRSQVSEMNNTGIVIGTSSRDTGAVRSVATQWRNGQVEVLANPYQRNSFANAVNDAGQVVGYTTFTRYAPYDGPNGQYYGMQRAALWNDGSFSTLAAFSAEHSTIASSINEDGVIVGYSYDKTGLGHQATMWLDGAITNLNTFLSAQNRADGWLLTHAYDINDKGWIVGQAHNRLTGASQAFLLAAAVPEPGAGLMLAAGLCILLGTRYRKAHDGRNNGRLVSHA